MVISQIAFFDSFAKQVDLVTALPSVPHLPINLLASCFNSTSATYKFCWFISLIEEVEKGSYQINKQDLFAGMIANAWYTVKHFSECFPAVVPKRFAIRRK
jgi:hypothetical protein